MKVILFSALVAHALASSRFESYAAQYNKVYSSAEERARALECFGKMEVEIARLNALEGPKGAKHGWNMFTDMCEEDFKAYHNLNVVDTATRRVNVATPADAKAWANSTVDWREKGAVTHVKDQGRCGSCWSFSSTGNMEGQHFLATQNLVSLSEEMLVQCSSKDGNHGCQGGLMDNAFKWTIANGGIAAEDTYPYTSGSGQTGTCDQSKESPIAAKFSSIKDISQSEDQMAAFVGTSGPLSIAVDAAKGWQTYKGGIMTTCTGKQLDHGVLAVGFGSDNGQDYWIVKNSWNTNWGEEGYIRLARGSNQCGLSSVPSSIQV
jgi:cathepsin F/cysteine peptidase B